MHVEVVSITTAEEPPSRDGPVTTAHRAGPSTDNSPTESRSSALGGDNNSGISEINYYIKLPLLITSTICAALQSTLRTNNKTENEYVGFIPRIVFFEFTFVNAYIILNYPWWQRMKKPVKFIYGVTGCILYLVAGAIVVFYMNADADNLTVWEKGHLPLWNTPARKNPIGAMSSIGFLALFGAILHLVDVKFGAN